MNMLVRTLAGHWKVFFAGRRRITGPEDPAQSSVPGADQVDDRLRVCVGLRNPDVHPVRTRILVGEPTGLATAVDSQHVVYLPSHLKAVELPTAVSISELPYRLDLFNWIPIVEDKFERGQVVKVVALDERDPVRVEVDCLDRAHALERAWSKTFDLVL